MASPQRATLVTWSRNRGPFAGAALLVGLSLPMAMASFRAAGNGRGDAAARMRAELEARHGLHVQPADVSWERPPARTLADAVRGTRALFLGARVPGAPRDLYRAHVRLTPEGQLLAVSSPINLTHTAVGDDHSLRVRGDRAAYATSAYGAVQAVTILDLAGEPEAALAALDAPARARQSVTDLLTTGVLEGVGRIVVRLDPAPTAVELAWQSATRLAVLPAGGAPLSIDAGSARLRAGAGATVDRVVHDAEPPILWAVETVRAVVGPAPIAWLEGRTFALADLGRRIEHGAVSPARAQTRAAPRRPEDPDAPVGWPPPDIRPRVEPAEAGEGRWHPSAPAFVARLPGAPPAFYETFVRPDGARPYVRVHLVAMDMRQLALGVVAGAEDPEPTVGPPGTGRLPHRREVVENLVAAFNGAFKTKHGEYGMVEEGRVLLPPMREAATIATRADGRVGIGSWPGDWHVSGDIVSLRQNLDPLVDRGVLNPRGRRLWGFPLPDMDAMQTQRSGLCVDRGGNLLYFYGADLSGPLLGEAMLSASCSYGIHLDMNPWHCAFVYTRIHDPDAWLAANDRPGRAGALAELYEARTMARGMMDPKRYLVRSPKDFFYLVRRPAMLERPSYRLDGGPL